MIDRFLSNPIAPIFFALLFGLLAFGVLKYLIPVIRRTRAFNLARETIEEENFEAFPDRP